MAKQDDENLIDYVLEVGVQATDAEDALQRWRKSGVALTVNVSRRQPPRPAPTAPATADQPAVRSPVMVPASGDKLPKDVGLPQKPKRKR